MPIRQLQASSPELDILRSEQMRQNLMTHGLFKTPLTQNLPSRFYNGFLPGMGPPPPPTPGAGAGGGVDLTSGGMRGGIPQIPQSLIPPVNLSNIPPPGPGPLFQPLSNQPGLGPNGMTDASPDLSTRGITGPGYTEPILVRTPNGFVLNPSIGQQPASGTAMTPEEKKKAALHAGIGNGVYA